MLFTISDNIISIIFLIYVFSNDQIRYYIQYNVGTCMQKISEKADNIFAKYIEDYVMYFFLSNIMPMLYCQQDNIFDLENDSQDKQNELENKDDIQNKEEKQDKKIEKYEDKYLNYIQNMDKEYKFTREESEKIAPKTLEIYSNLVEEYSNKINELIINVNNIDMTLLKYEDSSDDEYCDIDQYGQYEVKKNEKIQLLLDEKKNIQYECEKINALMQTSEGNNRLREQANKEALEIIKEEGLNKLKDTFIIEKTPLGNVLMFWNNKRGTFEYYSDNTIPYRYLEVVGRKYVKTFNCRNIFVDMEEELKKSEERIQREKEEKEEKERKERLEESNKINTEQTKKNVYAKFKSYNKEAGSGRVNTAPPPKNSIPNKSIINDSLKEDILVKENANRYTYEGKLSNFKILKKVDRKIVDKKYAMTFADFKKIKK